MAATHHINPGELFAACGRDSRRVAITNDGGDTTCKTCAKAIVRTFVGTSRGRKQYELTCKGGPWDGKKALFGEQVSGAMSMWIHVGEHVGRYNMNTGVWTPKEKAE